jgi:FkbM family methyltransferase
MSIILAPNNLLSHPAFQGIDPGLTFCAPAGFVGDGVGQKVDVRFDSTLTPFGLDVDREVAPGVPWAWLHEEIFEWMAVAESVRDAGSAFTMLELGAGYGRWLVGAAMIARQIRRDLDLKLVGVEAEPTHFCWMREHFINNGLDPAQHELVEAAVSDRDGTIDFVYGPDSAGDYGQHVAATADQRFHRSPPRTAQAVSIETLLRHREIVDLVDIDVQGFERVIVPAGIARMTEVVRRAYVSIHEPDEVAAEVRQAFTVNGWRIRYDFPFKSEVGTEFGPIAFNDGVQYWENARLL